MSSAAFSWSFLCQPTVAEITDPGPRDTVPRGFREQPALDQQLGSLTDGSELEPRAFRNVEKRMVAIGKIQNPKTRIDFISDRAAASRAVEISFSKLRFAVRRQIAISPIVFKHVNNIRADAERSNERLRPDKIEIVRRGVILRKTAPDAPHQASNREIEARRAVLPLIVAIRRKIEQFG